MNKCMDGCDSACTYVLDLVSVPARPRSSRAAVDAAARSVREFEPGYTPRHHTYGLDDIVYM